MLLKHMGNNNNNRASNNNNNNNWTPRAVQIQPKICLPTKNGRERRGALYLPDLAALAVISNPVS
jgi:hypothetical protein